MAGQFMASLTLSATGIQGFNLNPTVWPNTRLFDLSDQFMLFRFDRLRLTPISGANGTGGFATVAYSKDVLGVSPTTATEVSQLDKVVNQNLTVNTMPRPHGLELRKKDLSNAINAWRCVPRAYDDTLEYQGQVWFYGANNGIVYYECQWEVTFYDPVPATLSMRPGGLVDVVITKCVGGEADIDLELIVAPTSPAESLRVLPASGSSASSSLTANRAGSVLTKRR
jgi:hypothetical protein